jgi:hypothetical protein
MMRSLLRYVACAWLAGQLVTLVVPLATCCITASASNDDEANCCPGVGPGQVCPMHHTREGDRTCKMRNGCGRGDAMFQALTAGVGILTSSSPVPDSALHVSGSISVPSPSAISRADHPDAPPPRS